jgi:hypothetical protein
MCIYLVPILTLTVGNLPEKRIFDLHLFDGYKVGKVMKKVSNSPAAVVQFKENKKSYLTVE